jgi:plastocyanin
MRRRLLSRLTLFACLLCAAGCDTKGCRGDNSSGLPAAALPAPTFGEASITGRVWFQGDRPLQPQPVYESDFCGVVPDESVVLDANMNLANVLVYLDDVSASTGAEQPTVTLDQVRCRFDPHVMGVQVGQTLRVGNDDPMRHNVHFRPQNNPDQNIHFATGGRTEETSFAYAEPTPVEMRCDIHPWMRAFVGVFDHPFFATTGGDGTYEIDRVPAGSYELVAWHERLGERRQTVTVADAGDAVADIVFARRTQTQ